MRLKTTFCVCPAVIEKYTRNARFCLICNYVSKIIPALQSRCTRFRFPPLPESNVRERLTFVAEHEGCAHATPFRVVKFCQTSRLDLDRISLLSCSIQLDDEGMQALITLGGGDMRRTLNIFQASSFSAVLSHASEACDTSSRPTTALPAGLAQLSDCRGILNMLLALMQATAMSAAEVSQETVYQCTGNPLPKDIEDCYRWLMNETIAEAFTSAGSSLPVR